MKDSINSLWRNGLANGRKLMGAVSPILATREEEE
jgi:hypothetical protein